MRRIKSKLKTGVAGEFRSNQSLVYFCITKDSRHFLDIAHHGRSTHKMILTYP